MNCILYFNRHKMTPLPPLIILLSLSPVLASYGNYCGQDHNTPYAIQPIDELDRYCQIYNICVSALGMFSCFCHEQLHTELFMFEPQTAAQEAERLSRLAILDPIIASCPHPHYTSQRYYVAANNPGFTYIPFYNIADLSSTLSRVSPKTITFGYYDNVYFYTTDSKTFYDHFVPLAYENPVQTWKLIDSDNRYTRRQRPKSTNGIPGNFVLFFLNVDGVNPGYVTFTED